MQILLLELMIIMNIYVLNVIALTWLILQTQVTNNHLTELVLDCVCHFVLTFLDHLQIQSTTAIIKKS